MGKIAAFLPKLWTNWISLLGTVITTVVGMAILLALAVDLANPVSNNYTMVFLFMICPAAFVFGLALIPLGFFLQRRRKGSKESPPDLVRAAFEAALRDSVARRRIAFFAIATVLNILLVGMAGARGVAFLDSTEFCGTTCHVMQPEYESYLASPHAKVACVSCHIGPGASWAVKAKVDGLRQVWSVLTDSYHRPIPSPVHDLRPARDTCEQCHWPAKFHGNRVRVIPHFRKDQENTKEVNALMLKIGGEDPTTGKYTGIHRHVSSDVEVHYEVLDPKREKIGKVRWYEKGELKGEWAGLEGAPSTGEWRVMDCVDCHNRPTHVFDFSPDAAVERALASGLIDPKTPHIRELGAEVLTTAKGLAREGAQQALTQALGEAYDQRHGELKPSPEKIAAAAKGLADVYRANIYPEMGVVWDTHTSHLGHRGDANDARGCFRCHDDRRKNKQGGALRQDCEMCHEILHMEETAETVPAALFNTR